MIVIPAKAGIHFYSNVINMDITHIDNGIPTPPISSGPLNDVLL
jgi:hypothetical protein